MVIFDFTQQSGALPRSRFVMDSSGALYGTTQAYDRCTYCGTVFKLTPPPRGQTVWKYDILHAFTGTPDGSNPNSGLLLDAKGDVFGTTEAGGASSGSCGTVFELRPPSWTETIVHSFQCYPVDGSLPVDGVIADSAGVLYGTTFIGGKYSAGTVFALTPTGKTWTESILYNFTTNGHDGQQPVAGLLMGSNGALYGTTTTGGSGPCKPSGCGTAFELTPSGGSWKKASIYDFGVQPIDGAFPYGGVIADASGALYGTTSLGIKSGVITSYGAVYKLSHSRLGWSEKLLYGFQGAPDGGGPFGNLTFDTNGNLFGTTTSGGSSKNCVIGCGTAYRLSPSGGGWVETILTNFNKSNGEGPDSGLIFGFDGALYGTAFSGGTGKCPKGQDQKCGVVFRVVP